MINEKNMNVLKEEEVHSITVMWEMQSKLDAAFIGDKIITKEQREMAMLDECGETIHELKGAWCWWKKTQAPVDSVRVLEELVDVWHFLLGLDIERKKANGICDLTYIVDVKFRDFDEVNIKSAVSAIKYTLYTENYIQGGVMLTKALGFTIDQVYSEYLKKNEENYNRIKTGY